MVPGSIPGRRIWGHLHCHLALQAATFSTHSEQPEEHTHTHIGKALRDKVDSSCARPQNTSRNGVIAAPLPTRQPPHPTRHHTRHTPTPTRHSTQALGARCAEGVGDPRGSATANAAAQGPPPRPSWGGPKPPAWKQKRVLFEAFVKKGRGAKGPPFAPLPFLTNASNETRFSFFFCFPWSAEAGPPKFLKILIF